ncbi:Crp/Fnr family transcriptional regulator [Roseateles sp. LKC17W]|uniref:Crp/Fnr family transcriptional regulator n=1 Tax=Pelomonas margarita TaxID=3299031 RepID=A0ABW7FIM7_9BURK
MHRSDLYASSTAAQGGALAGLAMATPASQHAEARLNGQRIAEALRLLSTTVDVQRRIVRAGDTVYQTGQRFSHLYILNSGIFKLLSLSADGREQVVGLKFRGDWMGFAGIAKGHYACDAVAMDTGEVWAIRYDTLLAACARQPELMVLLHEAMSAEIVRERESVLSLCTLPADARVADFISYWADSLASRGLRTDQITLCMTRAEIGNYLGLTLETVSRALSKLVRERLISFAQKGRRDISIPDIGLLRSYAQRGQTAAGHTLQ